MQMDPAQAGRNRVTQTGTPAEGPPDGDETNRPTLRSHQIPHRITSLSTEPVGSKPNRAFSFLFPFNFFGDWFWMIAPSAASAFSQCEHQGGKIRKKSQKRRTSQHRFHGGSVTSPQRCDIALDCFPFICRTYVIEPFICKQRHKVSNEHILFEQEVNLCHGSTRCSLQLVRLCITWRARTSTLTEYSIHHQSLALVDAEAISFHMASSPTSSSFLEDTLVLSASALHGNGRKRNFV